MSVDNRPANRKAHSESFWLCSEEGVEEFFEMSRLDAGSEVLDVNIDLVGEAYSGADDNRLLKLNTIAADRWESGS